MQVVFYCRLDGKFCSGNLKKTIGIICFVKDIKAYSAIKSFFISISNHKTKETPLSILLHYVCHHHE
jgi:hypothetical protein